MAEWYYAKEGERKGPVSSSQLRQLAQSGELLPTDMVFKEGGTQWIPASSINNLFAGPNAVSTRPDPGASARRGGRERDEDFGDEDDRGYDEEPPIRRPGGSNAFLDILLFRRMIAPIIIMILFWLGILGALGWGLFTAGLSLYAAGTRGILIALGAVVAIPFMMLVVRLYAEVTIVVFRIHETLVDIKHLLEKDQRDKT
jgi:hypothetical protein